MRWIQGRAADGVEIARKGRVAPRAVTVRRPPYSSSMPSSCFRYALAATSAATYPPVMARPMEMPSIAMG